MSFFTDLQTRVDALGALLGCEVEPARLPAAVAGLGDDEVMELVSVSSQLARAVESVTIAASGVIAARSARERGHGGLAQTRGHRSPVSLIQDLTGASRADAARRVRIGEGLTQTHGGAPVAGDDTAPTAFPGLWADVGDPADREPGADPRDAVPDADAEGATSSTDRPGDASGPPPRPWHAVLDDALLGGRLSATQHDAIRRGLGEPPASDMTASDEEASSDTTDAAARAALADADAAHVRDAWALAAEQLLEEAHARTVEELSRAARLIRDRLDPEGAQRRFAERYRGRSFRMWTDQDGVYRASISFDDEAAAWVRTIIDTALRPRRGGPRFVDSVERERSEALRADERTNDQLTYDLVMDVLRTGALADAATVFGTRQAGVRVVITEVDLDAVRQGGAGIGATEDLPQSLPGWLVDQRACDVGIRRIALDRDGNPLFLGCTERLFTAAQRVALAVRDGGCRWVGCDRPASYCEAHHIDPWHGGGRTDADRGILLCRFHHMNLHHGGWRIARHGTGDFRLHPPPGGGDPVALRPRLALRYAWGDHSPPPKRFLAA